jgi:hypothetical protein
VSGACGEWHARARRRYAGPDGFDPSRGEQMEELARGHGFGKQEALRRIETKFSQTPQLVRRLDALGAGRRAEPPREVDDGLAQAALEHNGRSFNRDRDA